MEGVGRERGREMGKKERRGKKKGEIMRKGPTDGDGN